MSAAAQPAALASLQLRESAEGCVIAVRVHPAARRNGVAGLHGGALKVSLTAPPEDGRANAALIALLAELFSLQRAQIALINGASSRSKSLRLAGLTAEQVRQRLAGLL